MLYYLNSGGKINTVFTLGVTAETSFQTPTTTLRSHLVVISRESSACTAGTVNCVITYEVLFSVHEELLSTVIETFVLVIGSFISLDVTHPNPLLLQSISFAHLKKRCTFGPCSASLSFYHSLSCHFIS